MRPNTKTPSPFHRCPFVAHLRDLVHTWIYLGSIYFLYCGILADEVGSLCSMQSHMLTCTSIYLPFGIAMFQAANSQFLHIASRQKQYAHMSSLSDRKPLEEDQAERLANSRWRRILRGVERADRIKATMMWIGVGLVIQVNIPPFDHRCFS